MGGQHPESRTPGDRVQALLKALTDRVRRLEGRRSPMPLSVAPAAPATTTSASAVPLWLMTGAFPAGWQVVVTVRLGFDTDHARGSVQLFDVSGHAVATASGADGAVLTLTAVDPPFPLLLYGYTSAGTMFVTVAGAQAEPWSGDPDTGI